MRVKGNEKDKKRAVRVRVKVRVKGRNSERVRRAREWTVLVLTIGDICEKVMTEPLS